MTRTTDWNMIAQPRGFYLIIPSVSCFEHVVPVFLLALYQLMERQGDRTTSELTRKKLEMELHIFSGEQQLGPYSIEQVKAWLISGEMSVYTMSSLDGGASWLPLFCIREIRKDESLTSIVRRATSGDPDIEAKILQETAAEMDGLLENTSTVDRSQVQNRLLWKLRIYWKQVCAFRAQFPEMIEAKAFEASYYTAQARIQLTAVGFMRKESATSKSVTWGIVTGLMANQQEKKNALQALSLFDKALNIFDNAGDRLTKAYIYQELNQKENALRELDHIIVNFQDDPLYFTARTLRDEIETP